MSRHWVFGLLVLLAMEACVTGRVPRALEGVVGGGGELGRAYSVADSLREEIGSVRRVPPPLFPLVVDSASIIRWLAALRGDRPPTSTPSGFPATLMEVLGEGLAFFSCGHRKGDAVGPRCYEAWLRYYLGHPVSWRRVLTVAARTRAEARASIQGMTPGGAASFPKGFWTSLGEGQLEDIVSGDLSLVQRRLGFVVPDSALVSIPVLRVSSLGEEGGTLFPARYVPGDSIDRVVLNRLAWEGRPAGTPLLVALHEGWPGHHLQAALGSVEDSAEHPVLAGLNPLGYREGWAVYAESLAEEMHLPESVRHTTAWLTHEADLSLLVEVDAGVHAAGWSPAAAVDTLTVSGGWPTTRAQSSVRMVVNYPGLLSAYLMGYVLLRGLRTQAEAADPVSFDIRRFHMEILRRGPQPFVRLCRDLEPTEPGVLRGAGCRALVLGDGGS